MTTPDTGCVNCGANFILKDGRCAACWLLKHNPEADAELVEYLRKVRIKPASVTPELRKAIEGAAKELVIRNGENLNDNTDWYVAIITKHIESAFKITPMTEREISKAYNEYVEKAFNEYIKTALNEADHDQ